MSDDNLREARLRAYVNSVRASYTAEIDRLNVWVKTFIEDLVEAQADRDRARDAAVALEQENAQLQDVLKATDRLELSTRKDVAQARDAVHEGRSGEALDMLSDLLESLGGAPKC